MRGLDSLRAGAIVQDDDAPFADAAVDLCRDRDRAVRLGKRARAEVENHFSRTQMMKRLVTMLRNDGRGRA
jgi:glycosyltransferase involved in cell wall biosynthesis